MEILLKTILGLIALASILVLKFVAKDFYNVRKKEGYDNLSIWEKIKFNTVFYFILTSIVSFFVFLVYFIIIPIQINHV